MAHVQAGTLRALAVAAPTRVPALPSVPTFAEAGLPGMVTGAWYGVMGPAGLPRDVTARLNAELNQLPAPLPLRGRGVGAAAASGPAPCLHCAAMNATPELPARIDTVEDLHALERAAQVATTPCGEGPLVWHLWGAGEPVVLLHGGSGSWTHWARNVGALVRAGRRVLAPDLPGFGDSAAPPAGEDADALPPWLAQGLDALLGPRAVDLVGFSFGGLTAGLLAAEVPARVRRLVLVGATGLGTRPQAPVVLRPWHGMAPGPARAAVHRDNLGRLMLAREEAIDALALWIHDTNLARDRLRRRKLHQSDLLARTLPRLGCPVAGIWGAQDALYRGALAGAEAALHRAPAFTSLALLPGAGHWVAYEAADAFDAALAAALG